MYYIIQDLQNTCTYDLQQLHQQSDNLYLQAQILQLLLNREGLYHRVDELTVEERLEALLHRAGSHHTWYVTV